MQRVVHPGSCCSGDSTLVASEPAPWTMAIPGTEKEVGQLILSVFSLWKELPGSPSLQVTLFLTLSPLSWISISDVSCRCCVLRQVRGAYRRANGSKRIFNRWMKRIPVKSKKIKRAFVCKSIFFWSEGGDVSIKLPALPYLSLCRRRLIDRIN